MHHSSYLHHFQRELAVSTYPTAHEWCIPPVSSGTTRCSHCCAVNHFDADSLHLIPIRLHRCLSSCVPNPMLRLYRCFAPPFLLQENGAAFLGNLAVKCWKDIHLFGGLDVLLQVLTTQQSAFAVLEAMNALATLNTSDSGAPDWSYLCDYGGPQAVKGVVSRAFDVWRGKAKGSSSWFSEYHLSPIHPFAPLSH